jgi:hypothetical protein
MKRYFASVAGYWLWTDGTEVWAGLSGDHSGAELEGTRRPISDTVWSAYVDPAPARKLAVTEIDRLVTERIERGVVLPAPFEGVTLSASTVAQANWLNLYVCRDTYPVPFVYPNIDDTSVITVTSASEIELIYTTGRLHVAGHRRAGTMAKIAVQAAQSRDEIDAILHAFQSQ